MKQIQGRFEWAGNNHYGDNHRTLRILPRTARTLGFEHVRITSAGGMGKAGNTIRGRVEKGDDGKFLLVGETEESWVSDDDPWSESWPSTIRWDLVVHDPRKVVLDGETYTRPKGDPVPPG